MKKEQLDMLDGRRKRRNAKAPVALEQQEQEALFKWAFINRKRYPELDLMHHIPNGGYRYPKEAAAFKRRGVKPGIPDIFLPVARYGFYGLYIELKRQGQGHATTPDQDKMILELQAQGYDVRVCEGWEEASMFIESYLSVPTTEFVF